MEGPGRVEYRWRDRVERSGQVVSAVVGLDAGRVWEGPVERSGEGQGLVDVKSVAHSGLNPINQSTTTKSKTVAV